jgi:hypothetical protein
MPVHLIWKKADGEVVKGLDECTVQSPDEKQQIDSDLNHGVLAPGETSVPQITTVETFSWPNDGDPNNAITDAGVFIASYYLSDPVYTPDANKAFCGAASSVTFGDYTDSGGSHSAATDLATLLTWGDADTGGVDISLDLGRTYTRVKTGTGDSLSNAVSLAATAMDIGTVDGQLEPGDKATIYTRITVPVAYTDPANAGVVLFNMGLFFNYTE